MHRILIIEDDQAIRDVTKRILMAAGYECLTAESGARGLQLWQERGADLVITDMRMADMDGLTIVVHLRAESPRLPLIVMSGDSSKVLDAVQEVPDLSSVRFLPKPFLRLQLLEMVAEALISGRDESRSRQRGAAGD